MIEKIGSVKNPLTIIAIFAGIAEVSGTTVLPFISEHNQGVFIYFLIIFPTILILFFFVTLNFNNKALYAPSDFTDEENYIKIFKYDISKQRDIEIAVTQDNLLIKLNHEFNELKKSNTEKILYLEGELTLLKQANNNNEDDEEMYDVLEQENKLVYVTNFSNAQKFVNAIIRMGYDAEIYLEPLGDMTRLSDPGEHAAIWLGKTISLDIAKEIIGLAIKMYPFLRYIKLSEYYEPDGDYIFIGGATEAAIRFKLKPLTFQELDKIQSFEDIADMHSYIDTFGKSN